MGIIKDLPVAQITDDSTLQTRRYGVNGSVASDYEDLMKEGVKFPTIIVFYDGETYWLADGFHRLSAARQIGRETISCDVRNGSRRDAELYAMTEANLAHGLQLTREDKRKRVARLLQDEEWSQMSDRKIAKLTGTSHTFVAAMREQPKPLDPAAQRANAQADAFRERVSGNVATTNIGGYKVTVFKVNDRVKTNDDRTGTIRYITFRDDGYILHAVYLDNSQTTHNYGALVLTLIERDVAKAHWFNAGSTAYIAKRQDAAKVVRIEHDRTAMLKFEDGTLETVSWSYVLTQPRDPNAKEIVSELESGNVATGAPDPVHNRDWYWRNALTRLFETFPKWQRYAGVVPPGETGWFNGNRQTFDELTEAGLIDVEAHQTPDERARINEAGARYLGAHLPVDLLADEDEPVEDESLQQFAEELIGGFEETFTGEDIQEIAPSLCYALAYAEGKGQASEDVIKHMLAAANWFMELANLAQKELEPTR